jgi:serine/threonine protein kinase
MSASIKEGMARLKKSYSSQDITNTISMELENDDQNMVGTQDYISPEAICGKKSEISFAADLWAVGVIVWQLFSKKNTTPFQSATLEETLIKIKETKFEMPDSSDLNGETKDLIFKLLVKEPCKRLGANDISELMNHPFFSDLNFNDLYTIEAPLAAK